MKFLSYVLCLVILSSISMSVSAQKYKTPADTVKLNEEYVKVTNDLTELKAKLSIAQNNLPGYQAKAASAVTTAQSAASASSSEAGKATDGSVSDARSERNDADKALRDAKDSRNASDKVGDQNEKISKLNKEIEKKQQRLKDLDAMRTAIYAQLPPKQNP